jgi:hypothetical protein
MIQLVLTSHLLIVSQSSSDAVDFGLNIIYVGKHATTGRMIVQFGLMTAQFLGPNGGNLCFAIRVGLERSSL